MDAGAGGGVPVTLYRIDELPSKQKLYKIDINAQQNHLTGAALLVDDFCVVVVEGGPKAQKRYRKLLMQRIDWGEAHDGAPLHARRASRRVAPACHQSISRAHPTHSRAQPPTHPLLPCPPPLPSPAPPSSSSLFLADDDDDDDDDDDREERRRRAGEVCKVVWEGQVIRANFKAFRIEPAGKAEVARKLLKERGCEHYWDMAFRYTEGDDDLDLSMLVPVPQGGGSDDDDDDDDDDGEEEGAEQGGAVQEEGEEMQEGE